jgi:outer membrane protein insertion porin family
VNLQKSTALLFRASLLGALSLAITSQWTARAFAQVAPIVSKILVQGNQRVEEDAIRIHIGQQVGQPLDPNQVDQDVKNIDKMGFFSNVDVRKIQHGNQVELIYVVKEYPQVTDVRIEGMKAFRTTDDKVVAAIKMHPGSIFSPTEEQETINALNELYQAKGYLDAKITFKPLVYPDNTEIATFQVDESSKVEVTAIHFHGNKVFPDRELRAVMETSTYSRLTSWFTNAGALDKHKLQDDVDRLTAYYYDNGYLNVHVSDPQIHRVGNQITLDIDIDEGQPYKVGRVLLQGNLKFPRRELRKLLTLKPGELFRGSILQRNVLALSDFYSNRGYAFVNVDPRTQLLPATKTINVTFVIMPNKEVVVDRVYITGNTRTSDKVIRRELQVQEQEPYSAEAIRESKQRLDRLGYFSDTRITTTPSTHPDKIDLDVNVTEQNTAQLQVSGGFDSYSSVFGNFTLGNTNLFGGGESLILSAQVGFLFQNYSISYVEPWFLDIPLSVGLQLFDNKTFFLSFDQSSVGFTLNTTYPFVDLGLKKLGPLSLKDVTAGLGYSYQSIGVTGLSPLTTFDIRRWAGYTQTSELMPSIRRFTVDNPVDPRSGTNFTFSGEIGGLGGGNYFAKGVLHGRYFYPFLKSPTLGTWVVSQGLTFGIGTNLTSGSGGEMPLYERFFPGGVGGEGDLRGYQLYSLGPQVTIFSPGGQPISVQTVGGSKELLLSNEITFPILSGLGLRGVIFSDAGNAFRLRDSLSPTNWLASYGIGIRWKSPFGPVAVDIARPINPRAADQTTVFEFGTGAPL